MNIVGYGVVAVAVLSCGGLVPVAAAANPGNDTASRSSQVPESRRAEVVRIEREYRQRLARLDHLRKLAESQDDSDRLVALDELYERLREHRDEARELCETRHDHRQVNRAERLKRDRALRELPAEYRETRQSRRQIRGTARERAEQRWIEARRETAARVSGATHIKHAASRLAQKRWREEARDNGARRWERAARRSGMLSDRYVQREGDAVISPDDADREFERLWREVGVRVQESPGGSSYE